VLQRACEHARALAAKPPAAFGAIKRSMLASSGHAAAGTDRQALEYFIDHWFSPEAEERKQALIHSLQRGTCGPIGWHIRALSQPAP
jgi:enoyl-CoA hydratase/carnithine racemase